jgi:hypothetical protein
VKATETATTCDIRTVEASCGQILALDRPADAGDEQGMPEVISPVSTRATKTGAGSRSTIFLPVQAPAADAGARASPITALVAVRTAAVPKTMNCGGGFGAEAGAADQAAGEEERGDHRADQGRVSDVKRYGARMSGDVRGGPGDPTLLLDFLVGSTCSWGRTA